MKYVMPDGEIREYQMPQFKTPWNHDTDFESERTATYCPEGSKTKQEFKEESDINVILERFMRGGDGPPPVLPEHFLDLTGRTTYYDMATKIADANKTFYMLDAETRANHLNDPNRWADAVVKATEEGDKDELRALGLDVPYPTAPPTPPTAPIAPKPPEEAKKTETPPK